MTTTTVDGNSQLSQRRRFSVPRSARRIALVFVLLLIWELIVRIGEIRPLLLPPPSTIFRTLVDELASGVLLGPIVSTLETLAIGTLIGMAVGLAFATIAVVSDTGHDLLRTLVSILNPLPSIAILPLAMIWFGLTPTAIIVVVLNSTVWPIALNADMGFRSVSNTLQRAARTLGIRGMRLVFQVLLPAALPHLLSGIRIAWAFAWRTVVAAELVFGVAGGSGGIGYYINQGRYFLETDKVFAALVLISLLGILIESVFGLIERRTIERWGMTKPT